MPAAVWSETTFVQLLAAILIGWILVDLWVRVIENLAYRTMGLDIDSTYHTFLVAVAVTLLFVLYVRLFNDDKGQMAEGVAQEQIMPLVSVTAGFPYDREAAHLIPPSTSRAQVERKRTGAH